MYHRLSGLGLSRVGGVNMFVLTGRVSRLYCGSYVTSVFSESDASCESAASQRQRQQLQLQQSRYQYPYQYQQVSAPPLNPPFVDSNPAFAMRSSLASYFSAPSIRSIDSDEYSDCSVRPSSSVSNAR